jgi:uncharacterized protein (DUF736 family)|nr:MAG TPA: Protein of unknown function (DUF736) [Caudoviricetes sp.]
MTRIGAGWLKVDKNEEHYISAKIDEAILPLNLTSEKILVITPNKNKTEDKHPDYYLELYKPEKKEEQKAEKKVEKNNTGFPV